MSIYSNVAEQDLKNLRKLAEQQKEQRAPEIKNRILKQTHDVKLAQSLSPILKKLDEVRETTQYLGDVIKKPQQETPQLAIENIPTNQPIENNESVIYDVELEKTLSKMKDNTGFFKTHRDPQRGWLLNNYPIKMLRGTKVRINENKSDLTPGLQKVFTNQSYETVKSMNDIENLVFGDIFQKLVIISAYQQKVVCLVVIDILQMISIIMSVEF